LAIIFAETLDEVIEYLLVEKLGNHGIRDKEHIGVDKEVSQQDISGKDGLHDFGFYGGEVFFAGVLFVIGYEFRVDGLGVAFELIVE